MFSFIIENLLTEKLQLSKHHFIVSHFFNFPIINIQKQLEKEIKVIKNVLRIEKKKTDICYIIPY